MLTDEQAWNMLNDGLDHVSEKLDLILGKIADVTAQCAVFATRIAAHDIEIERLRILTAGNHVAVAKQKGYWGMAGKVVAGVGLPILAVIALALIKLAFKF